MKTPIHNIAPNRAPHRSQVDEVSNACRQIGQAIRNALAPQVDEINKVVTNEYQRCQGLRTNKAPAARAPLALKADNGFIAPKGDDEATIINQANVVRRGEFEGVRLSNGTLVLKAED